MFDNWVVLTSWPVQAKQYTTYFDQQLSKAHHRADVSCFQVLFHFCIKIEGMMATPERIMCGDSPRPKISYTPPMESMRARDKLLRQTSYSKVVIPIRINRLKPTQPLRDHAAAFPYEARFRTLSNIGIGSSLGFFIPPSSQSVNPTNLAPMPRSEFPPSCACSIV